MSASERDEKQDRAVEDSFPASDPPASSGIIGPRATPRRSHQRDEDGRPKSTPTHDRHAGETAYQRSAHQRVD
jgi:hypothetical protein